MRNEMVKFVATIGKTLVRSGPAQQLLQHVAEEIVTHLDAALVRIWRLNATGEALELRATAGAAALPDEAQDCIDVGEHGIGRIAGDMRAYVSNAVANEQHVGERSWLMREGIVSFGGYPLIIDRRLVGVVAAYLRHPLTSEMQEALATVADQLALAIDYRRASNELEVARGEIAEAEKAKFQFLANMSHELRTPLNSIIGITTLLADTSLGKEQRQHVDLIRISGDALLGLVNAMLDFSKMQSGDLEVEVSVFDLHACVEETLDLLAPQASRKRLELSYSIDQKTPQRIYGDQMRLRQVLMNLVANAIRFTRVGDVNVSVSTRAREHGLVEITFAIRDTGIGIASERLQRMFNPFGQTDASAAHKFGGTHLGLAICKRLCEVMNATIDVESELDRGTTFTVTLVARAVVTEPLPHVRPAQPHLTGRRVLVVDDNATSREILAAHLDAWGMSAVAVASPADALARINNGDAFELALVDVNHPDGAGADASTEIHRLHETFAAMPIVLLAPLLDRAPMSVRRGAMSVVTKPVKPAQLYNAIHEALSVASPRPSSSKPSGRIVAPIAARLPLRILLAEDDAISQQVASMMLERLGYRCEVAANGMEALAALWRSHHDVVLMDVQMPDMDGFEATRIIWRDWEPNDRPFIIALTGSAMPGERERCLEAGMDYYLVKPVRLDELRTALEAGASWISSRRDVTVSSAEVLDPRPIEQLRHLGAASDEGIANQIVQSFFVDTPTRIAVLHGALATNDLKQVELVANSLKSASGTVGARQLAALFAAIEDKAEAGDHEGVARHVHDVERTFADAREALEHAMREHDQAKKGDKAG
ncbi:MAG: response regulator [Polyangiaceae bacterium]|nr:response regulator [Polyangiaceae bacterium]